MTTHSKHTMTFYEGVGFLLLACSLVVYALYHHAEAQVPWKQSPYLFPLLIALFLFPLALSVIKEGLHEQRRENTAFQGKAVLVVIAATALYIGLMGVVGFLISTVLFLVLIIGYLGEKRRVLVVGIAILFPCILYVLFAMLLHVMLP